MSLFGWGLTVHGRQAGRTLRSIKISLPAGSGQRLGELSANSNLQNTQQRLRVLSFRKRWILPRLKTPYKVHAGREGSSSTRSCAARSLLSMIGSPGDRDGLCYGMNSASRIIIIKRRMIRTVLHTLPASDGCVPGMLQNMTAVKGHFAVDARNREHSFMRAGRRLAKLACRSA